MALAVTASFGESCQLDISWPSAWYFTGSNHKYWIALRDGCNKQEWITESAAAGLKDESGLSRVQLNLSEIHSNSSTYNVSVKVCTLASCTEVEGILVRKVVQSGYQSAAVSATSDAVDIETGNSHTRLSFVLHGCIYFS